METNAYEYTTYPRQFASYRWSKPLAVAVAAGLLSLLFQLVLAVVACLWIGGGMEQIKEAMGRSGPLFYSGPGMLLSIGGVAAMLPALAIAVRIVRDRPFSSYSSSRGGWSWGIFLRSLVLSLLVFCGITFAAALLFPDDGVSYINQFTLVGFLICTLLVPVQAVAEEYLYRGLLMQGIGSWTRSPAAAILLSSLIFAASHTYTVLGIVAILCEGLMFAFAAWYTKGLETGSSAHIANNLSSFYLAGFGLTSSREGGLDTLALAIVPSVVYIAAVILLDRKFGWFSPRGSKK